MNFPVKRRWIIFDKKGIRRLVVLVSASVIVFFSVRLYDRILTDAVYDAVLRSAEEKIHLSVLDAVDAVITSACFDRDNLIVYSEKSYAVNTEMLNTVDRLITEDVTARLNRCDTVSASVPVGTLTKSKFLSGKGIPVKVTVHLSSSVSSAVCTSVQSTGINGSLYRISLNISVDGVLMFPSENKNITVSHTVPLGEMLIMGDVPLTDT